MEILHLFSNNVDCGWHAILWTHLYSETTHTQYDKDDKIAS